MTGYPPRTPPAWGSTMTVTASILYDLVQCPQRVALDAFGDQADRDEINPFVRLLWERGALFERETIAKHQSFTDLSKAGDSDRESAHSSSSPLRDGVTNTTLNVEGALSLSLGISAAASSIVGGRP
jgi:hypothetical protein